MRNFTNLMYNRAEYGRSDLIKKNDCSLDINRPAVIDVTKMFGGIGRYNATREVNQAYLDVNMDLLNVLRNFSVFLVLFSMTACGVNPSSDPLEVNLTQQDNGETIRVKQGGVIFIQLEGNPTTGYTWEVETVDNSYLVLSGEPQFEGEQDVGEDQLLGAGGQFLFAFDAIKAGTTDLRLVYRRPFEPDIDPIEVFSVQIEIVE